MKRIAAYIRVSTADQKCEIQRKSIEKKHLPIQDEPYEITYYKDKLTGTNDHRPGFQRLIKDVRNGRVDEIVVYKLDRAFRNTLDALNYLEEFKKKKVGFVSVSQSLDFSTPMGRMFVRLLAIFAEFEAEMIKERVTAGVKAAIDKRKSEGKCWGPKPIDAKAVKAEFKKNNDMKKTAKHFGCSVRTIQRALKRVA